MVQMPFNMGMYSYTPGGVSINFPPFSANPFVCVTVASFTCTYLGGPPGPHTGVFNLCDDFANVNGDYSTTNSFGENNGVLSFNSNDKDTFPPGNYNFAITITIGVTS